MEIPHEQQAMRGDVPPKELCGIDLLAYLSACYMYKLYHDKEITRDEGSEMKKQIAQALEEAAAIENRCSFIWSRLETASRNYMQDKTIENADKFRNAVYNLRD